MSLSVSNVGRHTLVFILIKYQMAHFVRRATHIVRVLVLSICCYVLVDISYAILAIEPFDKCKLQQNHNHFKDYRH